MPRSASWRMKHLCDATPSLHARYPDITSPELDNIFFLTSPTFMHLTRSTEVSRFLDAPSNVPVKKLVDFPKIHGVILKHNTFVPSGASVEWLFSRAGDVFLKKWLTSTSMEKWLTSTSNANCSWCAIKTKHKNFCTLFADSFIRLQVADKLPYYCKQRYCEKLHFCMYFFKPLKRNRVK